MHINGEFSRLINASIEDFGPSVSIDDKNNWKRIFKQLVDYQEEQLDNLTRLTTHQQDRASWTIHCGISSQSTKELEDMFYHISDNDNYKSCYFPDGIEDQDKSKDKKDGDWFIVGTGYLDCEYDQVLAMSGREHIYEGKNDDGAFEYVLVLKPFQLALEKELYRVATKYDIREPVVFAPMLRRLVFIETRVKIENQINDEDLMLKDNNLLCLKRNWRAVWNIKRSDAPHPIKTIGSKKMYELRSGKEFIIQNTRFETEIIISHNENGSILVENKSDSLRSDEVVQYLEKYEILDSSPKLESPVDYLANRIIFSNAGFDGGKVKRILSQSNVAEVLAGYRCVAEFRDVYASYPNGLRVCAYKIGYEYPTYPVYFDFSNRPVLYLVFNNDTAKYIADRIIYCVHCMQCLFPEYIWKGGYFE